MLLVAGLLALFLAFVGHEAGHAAAGSLAGFRFGAFGAGPICVVRANRRLAIRWLPPRNWGPFAVSYPVSAERVEARAALYIAGGPGASLLLFALALLAVNRGGSAALRVFPEALALASGCVFVATVQPFGTGSGIPSDGARVWGLLRGDSQSRSAAALLGIEGLAAAGVRPRDWPADLMVLVARLTGPPAYAAGAESTLLRRAVDCGDSDAARAHLQRVRDVYPRVPGWLRAGLAAEVAFWVARLTGDGVQARRYLEDARGPFTDQAAIQRAHAAVLIAFGQLDAADHALDEATRELGRGLTAASAFDRSMLDELRRAIERARL